MTTDNGAASYTGGWSRILIVYACILVLAGLQFVIAYEHIDTWQMFGRMLAVAIVEAGLAVMFFMHLGSDTRGFVLFLAVCTVFALSPVPFAESESFRMMPVGARD